MWLMCTQAHQIIAPHFGKYTARLYSVQRAYALETEGSVLLAEQNCRPKTHKPEGCGYTMLDTVE